MTHPQAMSLPDPRCEYAMPVFWIEVSTSSMVVTLTIVMARIQSVRLQEQGVALRESLITACGAQLG